MAKAKSKAKAKTVYLVASGDLRLSANLKCQPAQLEMEALVIDAFKKLGATVKRAHPTDHNGHCFIDSQKYGMEVFKTIPEDAPLVIAEAVWQYSHHVLHGLVNHKGPILTVANWSGQWPGLVGMLNLNGSMTKAGVKYATLWSDDFTDEKFLTGLQGWLDKGPAGVRHNLSHVKPLAKVRLPAGPMKVGRKFAQDLKENKAIMGVFDEGCMGMFNAIIPDELLNPTGVFKERLSQSALFARTQTVTDAEARKVYDWYLEKGVKFQFGPNEESDLTENQVLQQCKTYIAAVRIADEFGCATIGIQYQQGLKDLAPASDLAEGLLNNTDRPPVQARGNGRVLYAGKPLPHFNEVDECAGLDALVTNRVWTQLGFAPETTLHDVRYGEQYGDEFVWVFEISGAVPPAHLIGGYAGAVSERQPPMYFRLGGGTVKGVSKPGEIVWSRVYVEPGALKVDIGRGKVIEMPREETERRWQITTPQWPVMHAVTYGVGRDQLMAQHKSNHIQVVYAPDAAAANRAMAVKAAMFDKLGLAVNICGTNHGLE